MGFYPPNMLFVQSLLFQEMAALLFQFLRPQHLASSLTHFFLFIPLPLLMQILWTLFSKYMQNQTVFHYFYHIFILVFMCRAKFWRRYYHGTKRKKIGWHSEVSDIVCLFDHAVSLHILLPLSRVYSQGREPQVPSNLKARSLSNTSSFPWSQMWLFMA